MGLLDDAIREHLELRRRHGADPGLIAREEHDVFGSGEGSAYGYEADALDADEDRYELDADGDPGDPGPADTVEEHGSGGEGFAHIGQETAELDMSLVLGSDEPGSRGSASPVAAGRAVDPGWDPAPHDDQPGDALEEDSAAHGPTPDQERLWLDESSQRDLDLEA